MQKPSCYLHILIPKTEGAVDIKGFWPISLVGCLYKLLSKILALCLKFILPFVISTSQNAFVLGREIMDCLLLANEYNDSRLKASKSGEM